MARRRRRIGSKLERAGLLLLLLPALLLAQVLGGQDLLLHSHGETAAHLHIVPHEAPAHAHGYGPRHAEDVRSHEHDDLPVDSDGHDACEFRLASPGSLLPGSARSFDSTGWIAAASEIPTFEPWHPRFGEEPLTADRKPPEPSPPRKERSGIASLLSSSRAILI
jgi:hypothetical protein